MQVHDTHASRSSQPKSGAARVALPAPTPVKSHIRFVRHVDVSMQGNNTARIRILRDDAGDPDPAHHYLGALFVMPEPPAHRREAVSLEDFMGYLNDIDPQKVYAALVEAKAEDAAMRAEARGRHLTHNVKVPKKIEALLAAIPVEEEPEPQDEEEEFRPRTRRSRRHRWHLRRTAKQAVHGVTRNLEQVYSDGLADFDQRILRLEQQLLDD